MSHIHAFGIKPIILTRSIEDIAISLVDELPHEESLPGYFIGANSFSFIWLDECTERATDQQLLDMVIDLALPWYVNFYVSWYRLCQRGHVNALWVTDESLTSDRRAAFKSMLDFLQIIPSMPLDASLLDKRYSTFREQDRQRLTLDDEQKQRIQRLFSHYPDVDFSGYAENARAPLVRGHQKSPSAT